MKIIDILNKIAKEEEMPIFKYEGHRYEYSYATEMFDDLDDDERCKSEIYLGELNDEVEIIEKEPKDIEVCGSFFTRSEYEKLKGNKKKKIEKLNIADIDYIAMNKKINEIIDKLNEMENNNE